MSNISIQQLRFSKVVTYRELRLRLTFIWLIISLLCFPGVVSNVSAESSEVITFSGENLTASKLGSALTEHTGYNYIVLADVAARLAELKNDSLKFYSDRVAAVNKTIEDTAGLAVIKGQSIHFVTLNSEVDSIRRITAKKFSLRPVSFDLQGAPLQSVLEVLQEAFEQPIESDLPGDTQISLKLINAPADEALEVLALVLRGKIEYSPQRIRLAGLKSK